MTATVHYHHTDQSDDVTITDYLYGDPSTGVVLLLDSDGATSVASVSELVAWGGAS